jgi:ATP/maltotriose-dependent transcriptional regulator MalT/two-component SAPR family response regulator
MHAIARTKIRVPRRRSELLTRPRLINLLYASLDYKLVAIIAPAGYGKTSTLIDFVHQTDLPICWYTTDSLDNDIQRFIAYFIAAIGDKFPDFGRNALAILESRPKLDDIGLDQVATIIANELQEQIAKDILFVLDDYHFVNENDAVRKFINRLLLLVDEKFHLVIASRTIINLDFVLLVSRNEASGFGMHELAFTANELRQMVLQAYHVSLSPLDATELIDKTEGWPAGLALSIQAQWAGMTGRLRPHPGVGLHDYLTEQIFEQQPANVQEFLLQTSLLEEFDPALCEAVLGPGEWPALIQKVVGGNLLVLPIGEGAIRYHHLFQDFLQRRIAKREAEKREGILRRLAAVYLEKEMWAQAHHIYFVKLGDLAATANLIETIGPAMLQYGRLETLQRWIDELRIDFVMLRPRLLAIYGFVKAVLGEIDDGVTYLNQAEQKLKADLASLVQVLIWRSTAYGFKAGYHQALADADRALDLIDQADRLQSMQAQALRAKGLALRQLGQLNQALACWEQSLTSLGPSGTYDLDVAIVQLELGIAYTSLGKYTKATQHCLKSLNYWQTVGNIARQATLLNNLAVIYHLSGNYEEAKETLEQAITLAKRIDYGYVEAIALASIGDLYVDLEELDGALRAYEQSQIIARRINNGFLNVYISLARASVMSRLGYPAEARNMMKNVAELVLKNKSNYECGLYELEMGRLELAGQRPQQAIKYLEKVISLLEATQLNEYTRAMLYLAKAYDEAGNHQAATGYLEQAFQLALALEDKHVLVTAARPAKAMLAKFQSHPELGVQSMGLLELVVQFENKLPALRRRLRYQPSTIHISSPELRIQAFGQCRVVYGDDVVSSTKWQNSDLMREYFFYLLTHPTGIKREDIGLIVQPDGSPAQLKRQFRNTIYRLRQMFSKDLIVFDEEEDRYYFNRQLDYDYDVEIFEQEIRRAAALTDSPEQQIKGYEKVVELYKGQFLPDLDGDWVLLDREKFSSYYIQALLKLAEFYLNRGVYEKALDYSQRIFIENPGVEKAYQLAMRAHAALGDRAGVKAKFEQCRQTLYEEIAAPISEKTKDLYYALNHL